MAGFPCHGLLRELRQHDGHQGQLPCDAILSLSFHHAFPRSYAGRQRIGEAAGRSLFPCVPQVDADVMVWLHSPHDPIRATYIYDRIRMPPTYVSGSFISIPPVKPCRRRRHFSPQMRVTGSCSSTFQYYSLGNHLGVTTSPQSPLPAGYVTLPVDSRSPPLGLMPPYSRQIFETSFLFAFQSYASPIGARRTIRKIGKPQPVWRGSLELTVDVIERAWSALVGHGGFDRLAANDALQAHRSHQPSDGASSDIEAFSL
ncbi:hypothetical protein Avi_8265 (plasmid) [Allorhizobium ampelinum S4]|uniref:Uncharacterized protein n=1 Tax=Allorhizobium ampelinum (strain ATCC BAA-846 / DSM 112012 / S4) TaxID=311402 RepID=B9K441_ALLAM|nr:hypothetical protein Avi_8265 [Allorhizobium ampelinum S4]